MIGEFQIFQNHLLNQLIQNQDNITPWELRVSRVGREFVQETKGLESASESLHKNLRSQEWG